MSSGCRLVDRLLGLPALGMQQEGAEATLLSVHLGRLPGDRATTEGSLPVLLTTPSPRRILWDLDHQGPERCH